MSCAVYYIGGPWDLRKVARPSAPNGDREIVRALKRSLFLREADAPLEAIDNVYILHPVARDLFIAVHEELQER